ncbi:glutamate racemase [Ancylobacter radicis]|uniref:Glutamate racemase n=1 Tax=Ancylobacter radicis TaxID=2836179 RepID=A0ABS5R260_9HYPH|nr:glutamate racemase [Ancylobacter radicis]MBS9475758.1 glutamate racemase [Ancylobacter radicis]
MRIEASPASALSGPFGVAIPHASGPSAVSSSPSLTHTPTALRAPTILVFDSGLGGLSVFRELARARPDARFVYAADDAAFPIGSWEEPALLARLGMVIDALIARTAPDAVVIACNTASTLVLPSLRARHSIPFVGTVPAIKPACESSLTRQVSVLATPGTVKRDYTQTLIRDFAGNCAVTLVGSTRLAALAEAAMAGEEVADEDFAAEIAPAFVRAGKARTDAVVLACTHYPLVLGRLQKVAPWPVRWIDPAPAIARRLTALLGPVAFAASPAPLRLFSTGRPLDAALVESIAGRAARAGEVLALDIAAA